MSGTVSFDKYNLAVARAKDLQEQLKTKMEQWDKREEDFQIAISNMKKMCESILATNKDEMQVGKANDWSKEELNDLIRKTGNAYALHRDKQIENVQFLMGQVEDRGKTIERLQLEISRLRQSPGARNLSSEDIEKEIEKEKQNNRLTPSQKMAGNVKVYDENDDGMPVREVKVVEEAAQANAKAKPTSASVPYTPNKKTLEAKERARKKARREVLSDEEIEDIIEGWQPEAWALIKAMGDSGASKYKDIETEIDKQHNTMLSKAVIKKWLNSFASTKIVNSDRVIDPLVGSYKVFELSPTGDSLYIYKYKKVPVVSEMETIAKEHDNLEHGYGIVSLANLIEAAGEFKTVDCHTRKHPFTLDNGQQYIPDIICADENGRRLLIEYEIGKTTSRDFKSKCSRALSIERQLNFVAPNRDAVEHLCSQAAEYINITGTETLKGTKIRIASSKSLSDLGGKIKPDESWKYVFNPGKNGASPKVNY